MGVAQNAKQHVKSVVIEGRGEGRERVREGYSYRCARKDRAGMLCPDPSCSKVGVDSSAKQHAKSLL